MEKFPYYISEEIKKQFDKSKKIIKEAKQDRVYLITGREGAGKSKLAQQFGYYIDNRLNLDDIAFIPEQFSILIRTTKKKVVIYDEAFTGLSSKGAISKQNKELVKLLIECRQLGLIVFIVLPSIFILEKYIAIFRSSALFNVGVSKRNWKNRFYKVYNYGNKKKLYILGSKYMSYTKPKIYKKHRFYGNPVPTIDEDAYERKKQNAFREDKPKELTNEERKVFILKFLKNYNNLEKETKKVLTTTLIGHLFNLSVRTIQIYNKELSKKTPISQ